jgi:geranylgeranyl pyrophosphate synthase
MSRGGKRWRPIFGILLLQALGVEPGPFETMLSVIPELGHNAAVVIDDIEDASETRRGDATIHLKYGLATAINAANTLYFLPLLSVSNHPRLTAEQRDAIYRLFIEMFVQAHFGQAQDLYWSKLDPARRAALWQDERLGELILQAHAFKTAAVGRTTAEFVCIIADADPETRAACARFCESWGVAFQIVDDVNNFTRAPEWGKARGEDIVAGKFTFAIHKAVERLNGADKLRLMEILACEALRRTEAGLSEAIRLVEGSGALEACRRFAKDLMDKDWPALSGALPASRHKMMLRILLTKLIDVAVET